MKKAITISSLLIGVIFLSGCGSTTIQSNPQSSQLSEQEKAQNEETRLKNLAGDGELIKMSDQDKKDIADWVAKYKESKDTAFEKVDIDWNYDDPAGVWFAQKELNFNTVTNPITADNVTSKLKEVKLKGSFKGGEKLPIDLSIGQAKELFSFNISILNEFTNIINQYYNTRVPSSESIKNVSGAALRAFSKSAPLIGTGTSGTGNRVGVVTRITAIAEQGNSNIVYEILPLTQKGENASYFSEVKNEKGDYNTGIMIFQENYTLIAGQIVIKATKFEKVDDNYVRKTISYINLLNVNGSNSYPFLNDPSIGIKSSSKPELLIFGGGNQRYGGTIAPQFDITYKK